jgi:transposase
MSLPVRAAVRRDYSSRELRRLAMQVKNAAQARRPLAIAAVLDGSSREEAAKIGGMDHQTLRDWVIRFNEEGPDGLVNKSSPGAPGNTPRSTRRFLFVSWRKGRSRRSMASCAGRPVI